MVLITEGKVKLNVSKGPKISKDLPVFYNPEKAFDRDLSISFLKAVEKNTVLDLLCASGARGIRLAKEANAKVTYNDVSSEAIKQLKKNLKLNRLISKSKIYNLPANDILLKIKEKFDFIDIDPFGSPINFVFNSIKRLDKDGYLAVTATDTAPLYGVYKWTCFRKYGAFPIKTQFSHEIALRILAKAVIELGGKWNVSLTPVFAHATQHYYRIYFKHSRAHYEKLAENIGFVHYCQKCKNRFSTGFRYPDKCECGNKLMHAGPLYLGKLLDKKVITKMQKFDSKHEKFLEILKNEADAISPYYYFTEEFYKIEPKIEEIFEKLKKAGIKAYPTHLHGKGIKTEASFKEIKKALKIK